MEDWQEEEVVIDHDEGELREAMQTVAETQSLSAQFRAELESYLGHLDPQRLPQNFEEVVGAMTREDLLSSPSRTEKTSEPWFQRLLRDQVDEEMNREFQGRYRGLLVSSSDHPNEDRIQRGLAEIMLLDRQLQALTSQSKAIEAQSEAPSSPASQSSRSYSHTFLTHPQRGLCLKEKVLSSRSPRKEDDLKTAKEPVEDGKAAEGGEEGEEVDRIRLEELLSIDDQDLQRIYAYLPDYFYQENRRIDEALAQFDRLDRLQDKEEDVDQERADKTTGSKSKREKTKKSSFLSQQRLEREEHQHEVKIDNLLSQSHGMLMDYSSLLVPGAKEKESRSKLFCNLLDVPAVENVRPDLPVTREDILALLDNIKDERQGHEEEDNEGVGKLVDQYKDEIDRLEHLRAVLEATEEGSAAADKSERKRTSDEAVGRVNELSRAAEDLTFSFEEQDYQQHHQQQPPSSSSSSSNRRSAVLKERKEEEEETDCIFNAEDLKPLQSYFNEQLSPKDWDNIVHPAKEESPATFHLPPIVMESTLSQKGKPVVYGLPASRRKRNKYAETKKDTKDLLRSFPKFYK
eukprot:gene10507-11638_t